MVDVEIIDAKANNQSVIVSAGPDACTCHTKVCIPPLPYALFFGCMLTDAVWVAALHTSRYGSCCQVARGGSHSEQHEVSTTCTDKEQGKP